MQRLTKGLTAIALAMILATGAFAQAAGPKAGGQKGASGRWSVEGLKKQAEARQTIYGKLGLTADQKKQVKAADEKFSEAVKAVLPKNGGRPAEDAREKLSAGRKEYMEAMKKILTPSQQTKYRDLMKALRDDMRKKREGIKP